MMNSETQRLAVVATICFFPTAIAGWLMNKKKPETALKLFRVSILIFLVIVSFLGVIAVTGGGKIVEALGTFY